MNGSGLIYAVIVGMWALFLVPMWVRRHDAANETRSVDRFSTAMRILSRRTQPRPDQRYVVLPRRPDRRAGWRDGPATGPAGPPRPAGFRAGSLDAALPARQRARLAAARRRNCMLLLLTLLVLVGLVVVGVAPWWAAVLAGAVLLLYLAHLRSQALRSREINRRRQAALRAAAARGPRSGVSDRIGVARDRLSAGQPRYGVDPSAVEEVFDREAQDWDPVPVPLPSYVTAPVVRRPSRVIDLTTPGSWASGAMPDGVPATDAVGAGHPSVQSGAVAAWIVDQPVAVDVERDELDDILEGRRAVND